MTDDTNTDDAVDELANAIYEAVRGAVDASDIATEDDPAHVMSMAMLLAFTRAIDVCCRVSPQNRALIVDVGKSMLDELGKGLDAPLH